MLNLEILDNIKTAIIPILRVNDSCLVDSKLHPQQGRLVLKLFVDRISGGIMLDECSRLNKAISRLIEEKGLIDQEYALEVSSPGINKELLTEQDFCRSLNRRVRIFWNQTGDSLTQTVGVVVSVNDSGLDLDSNGNLVQVPFNRIKKAKQIIEEVK